MKDHELIVTCKKTGTNITVSKKHYRENASLYEIVDGEVLEHEDKKSFVLPKFPDAKLVPKDDKKDVKPVAKVKATTKPQVKPPKL